MLAGTQLSLSTEHDRGKLRCSAGRDVRAEISACCLNHHSSSLARRGDEHDRGKIKFSAGRHVRAESQLAGGGYTHLFSFQTQLFINS